jgi:hypothetical protein
MLPVEELERFDITSLRAPNLLQRGSSVFSIR